MRLLNCGGKPLDLFYPQVMGVLNVTPDSFSDGGRFLALDAAVQQGLSMAEAGAAIIDVGGESTRPGAVAIGAEEELRRVIPVIKILSRELPIPISIDTYKPKVMQAAVAAGAGLINDINALQTTGALDAAVATGVPVCLMHMQGSPRTMQQHPYYQDVVAEVIAFLSARLAACEAFGIAKANLIVDPGFGFGKTLHHNLELFRNLHRFKALATPIMIGVSRKSMLGTLLNRPPEQRLYGSLAAAALAVQSGVNLLRVHDVEATVEVLRVAEELTRSTTEAGDNRCR